MDVDLSPGCCMSAAEIAAAFGVSDDFVYRLMDRDLLPVIDFGGSKTKRVPRVAVEAVIEKALEACSGDQAAAALVQNIRRRTSSEVAA
jgi:hypothetical protein